MTSSPPISTDEKLCRLAYRHKASLPAMDKPNLHLRGRLRSQAERLAKREYPLTFCEVMKDWNQLAT